MIKKLFIIILFISNSLVAQTVKPLTNYSFEELLNDENANHLVLEGCISLFSAITELTKKKYPELANEFFEIADTIYPSPVDFWATEPIIEIAKRAKKKIVIQINRANPRAKLMKKTYDYINDLGMKKTNTLIGHRQIFVASMGEGKTVIEKQRKGKAAQEIAELSSEIYSTLH